MIYALYVLGISLIFGMAAARKGFETLTTIFAAIAAFSIVWFFIACEMAVGNWLIKG